jgi:membrane associated rhomboid family serine protease
VPVVRERGRQDHAVRAYGVRREAVREPGAHVTGADRDQRPGLAADHRDRWRGQPWVDRLALLPDGALFRLPNGTLLPIDGVSDGAFWQLLTSMFTHVDLLHIGFNMLALWFLGPQLEAAIGRSRFLALYFVSGLVGSAFVYWLAPIHTSTVGASGAIFGLMGALLVLAIKVRADFSPILMWLGLNVVLTVVGRGFISWQGHLGGLVGGLLVALVIAYSPRKQRPLWQGLGIGLLSVLVLVAFVARTLALA